MQSAAGLFWRYSPRRILGTQWDLYFMFSLIIAIVLLVIRRRHDLDHNRAHAPTLADPAHTRNIPFQQDAAIPPDLPVEDLHAEDLHAEGVPVDDVPADLLDARHPEREHAHTAPAQTFAAQTFAAQSVAAPTSVQRAAPNAHSEHTTDDQQQTVEGRQQPPADSGDSGSPQPLPQQQS